LGGLGRYGKKGGGNGRRGRKKVGVLGETTREYQLFRGTFQWGGRGREEEIEGGERKRLAAVVKLGERSISPSWGLC